MNVENKHATVTMEEFREFSNDVRARFDAHDGKFAKQDKVLASHGEKLNEHSQKLDEHTRKLNEHGKKLDQHSQKLDSLAEMMVKQRQDLEEKIHQTGEDTKAEIKRYMDVWAEDIVSNITGAWKDESVNTRGALQDHEQRITSLEQARQ